MRCSSSAAPVGPATTIAADGANWSPGSSGRRALRPSKVITAPLPSCGRGPSVGARAGRTTRPTTTAARGTPPVAVERQEVADRYPEAIERGRPERDFVGSVRHPSLEHREFDRAMPGLETEARQIDFTRSHLGEGHIGPFDGSGARQQGVRQRRVDGTEAAFVDQRDIPGPAMPSRLISESIEASGSPEDSGGGDDADSERQDGGPHHRLEGVAWHGQVGADCSRKRDVARAESTPDAAVEAAPVAVGHGEFGRHPAQSTAKPAPTMAMVSTGQSGRMPGAGS